MITDYETYETWISDQNNADAVKQACIIPDYDPSGSATSRLIANWFFNWRIGWADPETFKRILLNNIETLIPQYKELLRDQPGIGVELDNLVQTYRERQLQMSGDNSNPRQHGNDTSTRSTSSSENGSIIYGKTAMIAHTGNDLTEHSGSDILKNTGTENSSGTSKDSRESSNSSTENNIEGLHKNESSPHVTVRHQNGGDRSGWSGDSHVEAAAPMSKKYKPATFNDAGEKTGGDIIEPDKNSNEEQYYEKAYQHMPSLDWQTLTAQAQNGHREYGKDDTYSETKYIYGSDGKGDITTRQGDKNSPDIRKVDGNGKETKQGETSGTLAKDFTNTTQYGSNQKVTYNGKQETIDGGKDENNRNGSSDETNINVYGNINEIGSRKQIDREIVAGRNEDPATLLNKAMSCIKGSNAWKWFRRNLESCFLLDMEEY